MAATGESTPRRRKEPAEREVRVDDPVKVTTSTGTDMLGLVRDRTSFDPYDAPDRVTVEGTDRTLNTSVERVTVVDGTDADIVADLVGGGD